MIPNASKAQPLIAHREMHLYSNEHPLYACIVSGYLSWPRPKRFIIAAHAVILSERCGVKSGSQLRYGDMRVFEVVEQDAVSANRLCKWEICWNHWSGFLVEERLLRNLRATVGLRPECARSGSVFVPVFRICCNSVTVRLPAHHAARSIAPDEIANVIKKQWR
jgi:hypothetical protein